jgi:hypothetical protein
MIKLTTDMPDLKNAQWFREATMDVPFIKQAAENLAGQSFDSRLGQVRAVFDEARRLELEAEGKAA